MKTETITYDFKCNLCNTSYSPGLFTMDTLGIFGFTAYKGDFLHVHRDVTDPRRRDYHICIACIETLANFWNDRNKPAELTP